MMFRGILVGIGVLGGMLSLLGLLFAFLGALFVVAVQWQRSAGGAGGAVVVVIMALCYCICPLAFFLYCCAGVVRSVTSQTRWQRRALDATPCAPGRPVTP
jgi:hypothetical protein